MEYCVGQYALIETIVAGRLTAVKMYPHQLPGIGFAAAVRIGPVAVDENTVIGVQRVLPAAVSELTASGQNREKQIRTQVLPSAGVTLQAFQITDLLDVEEITAGELTGRVQNPMGFYNFGSRIGVKHCFSDRFFVICTHIIPSNLSLN